eukprot:scaffold168929_cov28-Attheya_sp.AAC.1
MVPTTPPSNDPSSQPSMNPSKESSPPSPQVTPFTDTGGNFTLKEAVDAFIIDGEDWDGADIYGYVKR